VTAQDRQFAANAIAAIESGNEEDAINWYAGLCHNYTDTRTADAIDALMTDRWQAFVEIVRLQLATE
jgi:hypothetical protein